MSRASIVLFTAALAACSDTTSATAFDLSAARAEVMLQFADAAVTTPSPMTAVVLQLPTRDPSATFDDGSASIDGVPFSVTSLGGEGGTIPTFRADRLPPAGSSTLLRATDGRALMEMTIDNLLVPRSVVLTGSPDGKLHPGAVIALEWSPPTDSLLYASVVFRPADPTGGVSMATDSRVDGSRITFTVPKGSAGSGVLTVTAAATLPVRTCHGVGRCSASTSNLTVTLPTTLAPAN